jgi:DivIVA domain-containing protein
LFWFMLIALVAVVAAVALAVLGNGGTLPEVEPDRLHDPLPGDRPLHPTDLERLRIPVTLRGYRMTDVDDVLDRLGAELAERDARIAELQAAATGVPGTPPPAGPPIGHQAYAPEPLYEPEPEPGYRPGADRAGHGGVGGYAARPAYPPQPPRGTGPGVPGPSAAQSDADFDPWRRHGE